MSMLITENDMVNTWANILRSTCLDVIEHIGLDQAAKRLGIAEQGVLNLQGRNDWEFETALKAAFALKLEVRLTVKTTTQHVEVCNGSN